MTTAVVPRYKQFVGSGTTGPFSFTFPIAVADGIAQITVGKVDASGNESILALTTGYTIELVNGGDGGGIITTTANVANDGSYVYVLGSTALDQDVQFRNQGFFFGIRHEKAFDKVHYILQELSRFFSLSLKFTDADIGSANATLPVAALRANKALVFDASGNAGVSNLDISEIEAGLAGGIGDAEAAADAAEGYRDQTLGYRNEAEGFKDDAAASAAAADANIIDYDTATPTTSDFLAFADVDDSNTKKKATVATFRNLIGGSPVLSTTTLASAAAEIEITSGIDASFDTYFIEISNFGITPDDLAMQFSTDGGTTYKSSSVPQDYNQRETESSSIGVSTTNTSDGWIPIPTGGGASTDNHIEIELQYPADSGKRTGIFGVHRNRLDNGHTFFATEASAGVVNAVRIYRTGGGNLPIGTRVILRGGKGV